MEGELAALRQRLREEEAAAQTRDTQLAHLTETVRERMSDYIYMYILLRLTEWRLLVLWTKQCTIKEPTAIQILSLRSITYTHVTTHGLGMRLLNY